MGGLRRDRFQEGQISLSAHASPEGGSLDHAKAGRATHGSLNRESPTLLEGTQFPSRSVEVLLLGRREGTAFQCFRHETQSYW